MACKFCGGTGWVMAYAAPDPMEFAFICSCFAGGRISPANNKAIGNASAKYWENADKSKWTLLGFDMPSILAHQECEKNFNRRVYERASKQQRHA